MKIFDASFASPEQNLACDEALLDLLEEGSFPEVLRFWTSPAPFAVLGYSNAHQAEADFFACQRDGIPVLRRSSGGGAVLQGPGCLNYALTLDLQKRPELSSVTSANYFIMEHHKIALSHALGKDVSVSGITDLSIGSLKFSGNAQRRKRNAVLFHGTFLLNFDLTLIEKYLKMPSKEPDYRQNRPHSLFVANLGIKEELIKKALSALWGASEPLKEIPEEKINELIRDRYSSQEWNLKY